jgi:C-terminal processing protease CtpA/Prc
MRLIGLFVTAMLLFWGTTLQADDPPEGSIGVMVKIEEGKIVVVDTVAESPAQKAGIKAGDILLKVNDFKVKDQVEQEDLETTVKEIVKHKPGEKIKLTMKRDDKEMVIEVTVGKRSEIFKKSD